MSESTVTITLIMPADEADAFARLLKRLSHEDCVRRSNRVRRYPDRRQEHDVIWSAVQIVERQFVEAGHAPR